MHRIQTLLLALACTAVVPLAPAEDSYPVPYIGYRGNGTGVFPDDCRPVLRWQEFAGMRQEGEGKKAIQVPDPDSSEVMDHIVWRTAMPNMTESSPIVVGRRVYTMCEPGWPIDSGDASSLVCVDADDGTILWQRPVDPFDTLPPAEQEQAKAIRRTFWHRQRLARSLQMRSEAVARSKDDAQIDALIQEAEEAGLRGLAGKMGHEYKGMKARGTGVGLFAGQNWGWDGVPDKDLIARHDGGARYPWLSPLWSHTTLGITYPTPCSDGETIYATTAQGAIAAFSPTGERQWLTWIHGPGSGRKPLKATPDCYAGASPILIGDRLIWRGNGWVVGLDRSNGAVVWAHELDFLYVPIVSTPIQIRVADEDLLLLSRGMVIRPADGTIICQSPLPEMTGMANHCFAYDPQENLLYFGNGGHSGKKDWGSNTYCARLSASSDGGISAEIVWQKSDKEAGGYLDDHTPVLYRGFLYLHGGPIFDARTGAVVPSPHKPVGSQQGLVIAGDRIWGGPSAESTEVTSLEITPDGTLGSPIVNHLDHRGPFGEEKLAQLGSYGSTGKGRWYNWTTSRGYPFFSGNRAFFRTFDYLYCIGDQNQPFVPSRAFAARGDEAVKAGDRAGKRKEVEGPRRAAALEEATVDRPGLRQALEEALATGKTPSFRMSSTRSEVQVTALEGDTLHLQGRGLDLRLPFARLGDDDLRALGRALER